MRQNGLTNEERKKAAADYRWFSTMHPQPWCWACGRMQATWECPSWWSGPWMIERAHIVNNPRYEDRRAVILLCSLCHRIEHGHKFDSHLDLPDRLSVGNMLWLKSRFDPEYYDRAFLAGACIGKLPRAVKVSALNEYLYRRLRVAYPFESPVKGSK